MNRIKKYLLRVAFLLDALIAVGFGGYSWFLPNETFGTIISIPEVHSSAFFAILSSLSLFYILIGLTCLIAIKASRPTNLLIGYLMLLRHLLEGLLKIGDLGKAWLIGNPIPDLVIHSIFVMTYLVAISLRANSAHD